MQETQEIWIRFLGQEDLLEEEIVTYSFLPGEFQGQRGLVGYSPWGLEESNMTEQLTLSPLSALLSHRLIMLRLIIDNGRCIFI